MSDVVFKPWPRGWASTPEKRKYRVCQDCIQVFEALPEHFKLIKFANGAPKIDHKCRSCRNNRSKRGMKQ